MNNGNLYIIATPIGNLDDITSRALKILNEVDLIIAEDTRHSLKLLNHFNISKPLSSYHKFNEKSKSNIIIQKILNGLNVALISDAGTPGICDPGNIIISECIKNKINIIPVPGACAFIQALICSGFSTNSFSFYGFLPTLKKERFIQLNKIKNCNTDLIILYEAPHKLLDTLKDLSETFGNIDICISREITKIHETHLRTKIDEAIIFFTVNDPKGEFVLILNNMNQHAEVNSINDIEVQNKISEEYIRLKDTMSIKDISKKLSLSFDVSKNDIYDYLIQNK